jgi:hypothetical protein
MSILHQVPQPAGTWDSPNSEPISEDNDEEPLDNDKEAFGVAVSTKGNFNEMQGLSNSCNQECEADITYLLIERRNIFLLMLIPLIPM